MHTIEAAVAIPLLIFFTAVLIFISLGCTGNASAHAENISEGINAGSVSNTDIARTGDILYELYEKYSG